MKIKPVVYAGIIMVLVPGLIIFNTVLLLRAFRRDTDFELNNKALLVASAVGFTAREELHDTGRLSLILTELVNQMPEIKAVEILSPSGGQFLPVVSTSEKAKTFSDPVVNQLAWGTGLAYSKQLNIDFTPGQPERVWLVAAPIADGAGTQQGLVNLYLSASEIDRITNRSMTDALVVLAATIAATVLLLLNHFRFFETAILYRKLQEVDQLKDDFISVASHELKTPMTAIYGFAYLLAKNPNITSDQEAKKKLGMIMDGAARLKTLVEDMLDVSRIEQNRMKFDMKIIDIREIVTRVIEELKPQAEEKNLKLVYNPSTDPVRVNGDTAKLHQIIMNLISNAIKYTPAGEVTVFHQTDKTGVKTYVKDTGVGINAADREKLFTRFTRFYNSKTANVAGTGLGLWITKQLVEKMGGKITVDSIEGQGSQFVIIFPPGV